jgi:hypothetical protein
VVCCFLVVYFGGGSGCFFLYISSFRSDFWGFFPAKGGQGFFIYAIGSL